jgi:SAM-dependent methyltransferase
MSLDDAVRYMRRTPGYQDLVEEAYLDEDPLTALDRFRHSVELDETVRLLGGDPGAWRVLDLGAGTGMASMAFADLGARQVLAVEPDTSAEVGLARLAAVQGERAVVPIAAFGSGLPLRDGCVDVVYCRQVLHHIPDLDASLAECARVLRPGGTFLAAREHVVDDDAQLARFLAEHPVHRLAGGEHAWSLAAYRGAITGAGLDLRLELGPYALALAPEAALSLRVGPTLAKVARLPGVRDVLWARLRRPKPGRLYSFLAVKPGG